MAYDHAVPGRLLPLRDDWFAWRATPPGVEVAVRFEVDGDGRHRVVELRVRGEVTNEALRAIAIGRIEATADVTLGGWDTPDAEPVALVQVGEPATVGAASWHLPHPEGAPPAEVHEKPKVQRGRSDDFYRQVADEYREHLVDSHRPAALIAEAHGVPLTTAHRWIREARRRGYLPPGRPGRAG